MKIVRAKCGDDAGLLGAARLAFKDLDPQITQISLKICDICEICDTNMRRLLVLTAISASCMSVLAQDITTLDKIGPVVSLTKSDKTVTLNCQDNSQVQLTILAPDLIRVRASFTKPIPLKDHSWAIAKQDWTTPRWNLSETSELANDHN